MLELGDCRHRRSVANYGIDEAVDGGVGVIYPLGKAAVEGILLGAVKATWQYVCLHKRVIRKQVAHIAGVGVELLHNSCDHIYLHSVVHGGQLHEGGIDGVGLLYICRNLVGKEHILRLGEVVKVDHLAIISEHLTQGLALLSIPLLLL